MKRAFASLALVIQGACVEAFVPEVGPLLVSPCENADSDPARDVSLARDLIAGVFVRGSNTCLDCHSTDGATPIGLAVGGLDLSSHQTLLRGGARGGTDTVVVGEPCASVLIQKINDAPPFGGQMPLEGPPLAITDRQLISDWIVEGARDN
ncbi:MAG: c-type cytochrome domain-containing protein [Kofleriaceae bacterium]